MNLPIYIVSLKRDIERRNKINDVFHRLNINFDFFDAIDAKDPQNKEIIDKMRLSGVGAEMTDGEIACTLSHQLIYKDMIDKNIEWAVILEDDVIAVSYTHLDVYKRQAGSDYCRITGTNNSRLWLCALYCRGQLRRGYC